MVAFALAVGVALVVLLGVAAATRRLAPGAARRFGRWAAKNEQRSDLPTWLPKAMSVGIGLEVVSGVFQLAVRHRWLDGCFALAVAALWLLVRAVVLPSRQRAR